MSFPPPTADTVIGLLRGVIDPELGVDIVELGMVKDVVVAADGDVRVRIALTTSGCPLRAQIQRDVRARVGSLPGVTHVGLDWTELSQDEKAAAMAKARWNKAENAPDTQVPPTTKVIMIASGKGGVGKSSLTANLAVAMARDGLRVGVVDADIYGFSIPRMLGVTGKPTRVGDMILPPVAHGVKVISVGMFVDGNVPVVWRGPMLHRALQQFLADVYWGDLDFLVVDLPPGTGDVALSLGQKLPNAEVLVVTTPQ